MNYAPHTHLLFQSYSVDGMRDQQILEDVKQTLELLTTKAPGRAIEVRVPPYAAVQVMAQHIHAVLLQMLLRWMHTPG